MIPLLENQCRTLSGTTGMDSNVVYDQSSIAPLGRIKYLTLNLIKFSRKGFSYMLKSIYILSLGHGFY